MTRWARAGNTQKHKKMPSDATPWEELSSHVSKKSMRKKLTKNEKKLASERDSKDFGEFQNKFPDKNEVSEPSTSNLDSCILNATQAKGKFSFHGTDSELNVPVISSLPRSEIQKQGKFLKVSKAKKIQKQYNAAKKNSGKSNDCVRVQKRKHENQSDKNNNLQSPSLSGVGSLNDSENDTLQLPKKKKMLKVHEEKTLLPKVENNEDATSVMNHQNVFSEEPFKDNSGSVEGKDCAKSLNKQTKKKANMKKLKCREKKGIAFDSCKSKCKLDMFEKSLPQKGLSPVVMKNIKTERKKEELKFREKNKLKTCFNCRQPGHILSECPDFLKDANHKNGLCFKCGSDKHFSNKCRSKIEGHPYAECFICKERGHITRNCPQNKNGIYPKGGKCDICGNVNHLRKDCPTLHKKTGEEQTIAAHTIHEGTSVDAEIEDDTKKIEVTEKKPKVVKF